MIQIENTLISEEILEKDFACNLNACKGACCVEGQSGAPLEKEELPILDAIFEQVRPFLRPEGVQAITAQGTHVKGADGEWETPLVNNEECAYVIFDARGIAKCGLEAAYNSGTTQWKKPISCHLYPVRVKEYSQFTAVNYHKWVICDPACDLGSSLQLPVYKFVKDALIRKFGEAWYSELEVLAQKNP